MYKKVLIIIILGVLISLIVGSVLAKDLFVFELKDGSMIVGEIEEPLVISVKTKEGIKDIDMKDISYIYNRGDVEEPAVWKLEAPWYLITGKNSPRGWRAFQRTIEKSLGKRGGILGGYSGQVLVEHAEKYLKSIRQSNIIFLILPEAKEFQALKELREKYPELLPISYEEFDKYSPLIYLTYDIKTEKMRGVIIADKVDVSLAEMLLKKDLSLNTFLRYEKGQLKEIEEK